MEVSTIVAEINTAAQAFAHNTHGSREKLLELCGLMTAKLETPSEVIQRVGWAEESTLDSRHSLMAIMTLVGLQPARTAGLRSAVDLGLFERLKEADGPMSAESLAKASGAEPALIGIFFGTDTLKWY